MALTLPRYVGKNVAVDVDGAITIWSTLTINTSQNTDDATAADSDLDEVVGTTSLLEFTLTGFLGSVNNGATLPGKGDTVATLDVDDGAGTPTSLLPDISEFTNLKVLSVNYSFAQGPATFELSGRSGVLAV